MRSTRLGLVAMVGVTAAAAVAATPMRTDRGSQPGGRRGRATGSEERD
jgi:hypothetical protein